MVDARNAQTARVSTRTTGGDRWAGRASFFKMDPRRDLDRNMEALAGLIAPSDTILDVGGGAGRISLPLALRCREVVNIEPSAGMREAFEASAAEANIRNARCIGAKWPRVDDDLRGDVAIVANVTYFIRDIVPFIERLNQATRRLVVISGWSVPPPNQHAGAFAAVHDEPLMPLPGHRDLLPVLWDMGLLPEVRVLPEPFRGFRARPTSRGEAIAFAVQSGEGEGMDAVRRVASAFDDLFAWRGDTFEPRWLPDVREQLITWSPQAPA
jgi:SAM-dependent methyltransferase